MRRHVNYTEAHKDHMHIGLSWAGAAQADVVLGCASASRRFAKVIFATGTGNRHPAQAEIAQATVAVLERLRSSEPFAWWISFLPRLAGHRPIDAIAYGEDGERVGAHTLKNP